MTGYRRYVGQDQQTHSRLFMTSNFPCKLCKCHFDNYSAEITAGRSLFKGYARYVPTDGLLTYLRRNSPKNEPSRQKMKSTTTRRYTL